MKHQVDHYGSITLFPSYREMELISKSLITKGMQLRVLQNPSLGDGNEIISMIVCANEVMVLSNKAKELSSRSHNPETAPIIPEEKTLGMEIDDFLTQPWSTADFEAAKLVAHGFSHHITCMKYAEGSPNHPIRVSGMIDINGQLHRATWDSWGRCNCTELSQAQSGVFDLVRFGEKDKESDSAKIIVWGTCIFLASLLICAAFYLIQNPN